MPWHARTPAEIHQYGYITRTSQEAYDNCVEAYNLLGSLGWTLNAVCGMLGNAEGEGAYNPWSWQNEIALASTDPQIDTSLDHGYGLTGFTPSGKYIHYPASMSSPYYAPYFSDIPQQARPEDGAAQLLRINVGDTEVYIVREPMTFAEYISSTDTVDNLTYIWMRNHENPASFDSLPQRREAANYWYNVLQGLPPPTPPTPTGTSKMPLWFYLKKIF